MEVNPEKAKKRREHMAKRTRVERWTESSGNEPVTGRVVTVWPLLLMRTRAPGTVGGASRPPVLNSVARSLPWRSKAIDVTVVRPLAQIAASWPGTAR
jgi:hypothetical protein